ncbi:hypothetical protein GALMADRAFT_229137 [Galerina marginata CBS 339.88]|uniref:Uncharacterized protein n=1 Tax=Galerina marginata (strain CBS 339.88) TaxID=685588 RepID=A0A067SN61_GALM3|nr:hypothetical protein GALMADRAFT_229137 [Galerina marginata CBS 339.88]
MPFGLTTTTTRMVVSHYWLRRTRDFVDNLQHPTRHLPAAHEELATDCLSTKKGSSASFTKLSRPRFDEVVSTNYDGASRPLAPILAVDRQI